jgi:hypothetical protein
MTISFFFEPLSRACSAMSGGGSTVSTSTNDCSPCAPNRCKPRIADVRTRRHEGERAATARGMHGSVCAFCGRAPSECVCQRVRARVFSVQCACDDDDLRPVAVRAVRARVGGRAGQRHHA